MSNMSAATASHIRAWARTAGIPVAPNGPISYDVLVAYEQRNLGAIVPTMRHLRIARQLAITSREAGSVEVLAEIGDLQYDDLPLVAVALARMAWAERETPRTERRGQPRNDQREWTVDEAREAHRRYHHGERDEWVVAGERAYHRMAKARARERGAA